MSTKRLSLRAQWPALAACLLAILLFTLLCLVLGGCAAAAPPAGPAAPAAGATGESACDATSPSIFVGWGPDPSRGTKIKFNQIAQSFGSSAVTNLNLPNTVPVDISQINMLTLNNDLNGATIGFLTAHGQPTSLVIPGGNVPFANLQLGICAGDQESSLRYLLLSSCNTLAHGPKTCSSPVNMNGKQVLYACPGEWVFGQGMNVYDRWGPLLGNSLRMVCGASTVVTPQNAAGFWQKSNTGATVADAFLDALSEKAYIGLCMARGGFAFRESPIVNDKAFTTASNADDDGTKVYYHLQYSLPFADPYVPIHGVLDNKQQLTDTLDDLRALSEVSPRCASVIPALGSATADHLLVNEEELDNQIARLREFPNEAAALRGADDEDVGAREDRYVSVAAETLQGREPPFTVRQQFAQGVHLLLSIFPADPNEQSADALRITEKSVIIRFPVFVRLDEMPTDGLDQEKFRAEFARFSERMSSIYEGQTNAVYSEGGEPLLPLLDSMATVRLNPEFLPFAYSYSATVIAPEATLSPLTTISPYDAFLEALRQTYGIELKEGEELLPVLEGQYRSLDNLPLRLDSWSWGYTNWHNGEYRPDALFLTYEFGFAPDGDREDLAAEYPPRSVRVDGQTDVSCQ